MKYAAVWIILLIVFVFSSHPLSAQSPAGIDPEALIKQLLEVDSVQRSKVQDVVFDAEYIDYEIKGEGNSVEKNRYMKRIYIKYLPDTAWFHERYIQWYKEGKLQTSDECAKMGREKNDKKKKQGAMDISYPMLRPFSNKFKDRYTIAYQGIAPEKIENFTCHKFTVTAKVPDSSLINGDYYFESDNFHLVRVDFSPSKLVKKAMFKMNDLNMSLTYAPTKEDIWLPKEFHIQMKAKAMWVVSVTVNGSEYYRNPAINSGIDDKIFEVAYDQ